ncbi:MAG TPA: tetratricopeptide repeat protein [Polyangiaceae bacterium]|nr:tetratricopeptide repeat protein [Polyangiaceae bacterium]
MEDITPYDRRVEAAPHDGAAYLSRGKCHMRNGSFALGRADFERALKYELDPDAPPDERGISYERPNASDAHLQLAAALVELGDLETAAAEIELGLRLDASVAAFTARGAVKLLRGDPSGALADLDVALRKDPRFERALRHRAKCYDQLGKSDAAESDRAKLKALEDERENQPHTWLQRGLALEATDREGALAAFRRYAELSPRDVQGPLQQGRLLLDAERLEEAALMLQRARQIAPDDVSVGYHWAKLLRKQGDAAAALVYLDASLPRAVGWYAGFQPFILRERALAHRTLGNDEAAATDEAAAAAEQKSEGG